MTKSKDHPPREPTEAERRIIQEHRDRQAAEFAAIRLRVLGPSTTNPTPTDPNK